MADNIEKKRCKLGNTRYCELLNMGSCENCAMASGNDETLNETMSDIDTILELMPEDGISDLFESEKCLLCEGPQNERTCYAMTDLGNPNPRHSRRNFLGMKVPLKFGSIIPVQIASCGRCRRNYRTVEYLPVALSILISAAALIFLSILEVSQSLSKIHPIMPFAVFVFFVLVGMGTGRLVRAALIKKLGAVTKFNIFSIPKLGFMREKGWDAIQPNEPVSRLIFGNKRLSRGIFTGVMREKPESGDDIPKNV
ncbi:MAG: hypothetical protein BWY11_01871 [Firmicutes bacterium ADurb.Bin182]|nr:MAG: hypothetical protein BWY11_01871 [Firmicutes bacterium ADurb.Bin182]